ncbi:hypothetical protein XMM379_003106 [Aliiroseovarius sp. xm-m-379]|nr:hypothetical protein [Aliiroseovarius sp. xm-m-379]NRP35189.1 hypothetical protein [Aliiroseovarius sp. xm-a-104]NRP50023.1 hypothetical protein [Aliiroseovarius sp. xm-m-354]NRQ04777.1 hypothetical protein [Aliiroseovarius sp. xm-m-309]NRQ07981.1 hypothetical protein [Aliiroseovarius sp. xm-v-201]NRQ22311.1 hypothetical protein [Aliiroseovarius sp. xm-v-204]NRQ27633.1 hypothetical protein [Aliiroseovarius sp. xm-g-7]
MRPSLFPHSDKYLHKSCIVSENTDFVEIRSEDLTVVPLKAANALITLAAFKLSWL